jgi:solute carrier family 35 protein E1
MDSANTFAVVTMLATIVCLPVAAILEGTKVLPMWKAAIATPGMTEMKLATTLFMSGWYLYTYNEFAFKVLGLVTPVAQAVGNTVKRVVILVATAIAFGTPMTPIGIAVPLP